MCQDACVLQQDVVKLYNFVPIDEFVLALFRAIVDAHIDETSTIASIGSDLILLLSIDQCISLYLLICTTNDS